MYRIRTGVRAWVIFELRPYIQRSCDDQIHSPTLCLRFTLIHTSSSSLTIMYLNHCGVTWSLKPTKHIPCNEASTHYEAPYPFTTFFTMILSPSRSMFNLDRFTLTSFVRLGWRPKWASSMWTLRDSGEQHGELPHHYCFHGLLDHSPFIGISPCSPDTPLGTGSVTTKGYTLYSSLSHVIF